MSGGTNGPDWPAILRDYRDKSKKVSSICAEHGIGCSTLFKQVRAAGLPLRTAGKTPAMRMRGECRRLRRMVRDRIARLEARSLDGADPGEIERDSRALRTLIKAFEDITLLERGLQAHLPDTTDPSDAARDDSEIRTELARKIEALGADPAA